MKTDVERSQVGVEPGVLDREQAGGGARLIVVAVPHPRRRHEGATGLPLHPGRVDDGAVGPDLGADQRVTARIALHDEVQGDALVTVWALDVPIGKGSEHGPQGVRRGQRLVVAGAAEQYGDSAPLLRVGVRGHLRQPDAGFDTVEASRSETRLGRLDPETREQRGVVDVVQDGVAVRRSVGRLTDPAR